MIGNTAILIATHNRRDLVARAVPSLVRARDHALANGDLREADIWIYDDGSAEYDETFLRSLVPDAFIQMLSHQDPSPKRSVAVLRSETFQAALDFSDYTYFLHSDSDMLYDPDAFGQIRRIMKSCPSWGVISVFNTSAKDREAKSREVGWESGAEWYRYGMCGGSVFMRRPKPDQLQYVQVPAGRSWDGWYTKFLGSGRAIISKTSYCEHLGPGIHAGKPARNPTEYLKGLSL